MRKAKRTKDKLPPLNKIVSYKGVIYYSRYKRKMTYTYKRKTNDRTNSILLPDRSVL